MIDLKDFEEDYAEALKYCERRERGIPEDRWTTTKGQHQVARAIENLSWLVLFYSTQAARETYLRGLEAMKMEGED